MPKINSLIKRFNAKITLNQSILILLASGLATVSLLAVFAKYEYYALLFWVIPSVFVFVNTTNIAIHKIVYYKHIRMQNSAFKVIEKNLSPSFTRVKFVDNSDSTMLKDIFSNLDLSFWAKLDKNGIITLISKDSAGTVIYEKKTQNYIWFIKSFYIYKFFINSFDI